MADKKIGGREFRVGTVLATEALRLQFRLLQIIGGGVDRLPVILAGAGQASPEAKQASQAAAVAAFADMIGKADPDRSVKLMQDIAGLAQLKQASGAWGEVDIDTDFTDHKADLFPLLTWVLKEVLGDFFGGLQATGALSKMMGAA